MQNVEIIKVAITNEMGSTGNLHLNPFNPGGHSLTESIVGAYAREKGKDVHAEGSETVDLYTLDGLCSEREIDQVDFVKMDIEGEEIKALEGGEDTLSGCKKIVVEAYHPQSSTREKPWGEPTASKVKEMLDNYGFNTYVSEDDWVWGWKDSVDINKSFIGI